MNTQQPVAETDPNPIDSLPGTVEQPGDLTDRFLELASRVEETMPPAEVRDFITYFDSLTEPLDFKLVEAVWNELRIRGGHRVGGEMRTLDWLIDRTLGFDELATEASLREERKTYQRIFPDDQLWLGLYVQTPYQKFRDMLHTVKIDDNDVLYDLGSGYSRLPLYAGLTTVAQTVGIELMPERVAVTQQVVDRLDLSNVQLIGGNVLEQDLSDGTFFFMWQPFNPEVYDKVFDKLKAVATEHPIRIVLRGAPGRLRDHSHRHNNWVEPVPLADKPETISEFILYQSVTD